VDRSLGGLEGASVEKFVSGFRSRSGGKKWRNETGSEHRLSLGTNSVSGLKFDRGAIVLKLCQSFKDFLLFVTDAAEE